MVADYMETDRTFWRQIPSGHVQFPSDGGTDSSVGSPHTAWRPRLGWQLAHVACIAVQLSCVSTFPSAHLHGSDQHVWAAHTGA
eukprot:COSAG02_NODE_21599_length_782_cov_0.783309_1_plen_83_part_01